MRTDAAPLLDDLITLRRQIHADPEIGLDLPNTQRRILDALDGLPLEITLGEKLSSVAAVLRGGRPGPLVLLRGDMDALPLDENSGEPFASTNGAMHACGHDLHVAGLVGAARLLCARKDELAGDVLFMFQPGEEGDDGAGVMLEEGILDVAGRRPDAAYGLHVIAGTAPAGVFAGRPGPFMAAADEIHVRVIGAGGHGSQPFLTKDPVPVICEMVLALQTMVTRQFDIFDPVVLTVGRIAAGTKENIIPDEARFDATIRTFTPGQPRPHARRRDPHLRGHRRRARARRRRRLPPQLPADDQRPRRGGVPRRHRPRPVRCRPLADDAEPASRRRGLLAHPRGRARVIRLLRHVCHR